MKTKLTDIASVIRSKNAGPFELTMDILFDRQEDFARVRDTGVINTETVCAIYKIAPDRVIDIIAFEPAKAIKITIRRPICSGDLGETDVYGAQQHAPLLGLEFDL